MPDADREMLCYLQLAVCSAEKSQPLGRDRFLVLAGGAACRAGLPGLAGRCRELVLRDNPRHLLGQFESFPDALRAEDFAPLMKHLQRLCPPEQAEFLLHEQNADLPEGPSAAAAPALLDRMDSPASGA
ncbi:MAG: hypothetical protein ACE5KM_20810 [Planctomycetaceae bacterium]